MTDPRIQAAAEALAELRLTYWHELDARAQRVLRARALIVLTAVDAVDPLRVAVTDYFAAMDALDDAETGGTTAEGERAHRRLNAAYRSLVGATR